MTQTSELYDFVNNEKIDDFIKDAYEKCGIIMQQLSAYQFQAARRSLNYILSDWPNKGLNLWAVDQQMITIVPGQNTYLMPVGSIDVVGNECTTLNIQRQITTTGVPDSSSGVPANAFDNNLATACTQTAPNGWISYDLGLGNDVSIPYVGIISYTKQNYTIACQYSHDNMNWYTYNEPQLLEYLPLTTIWIVPYQAPLARYFRILETAGATLNINELYFSIPLNSKIVTRLSRQEWISLPNKNVLGAINAFVVQRQINPVIQFWNAPAVNWGYTNVLYYRSRAVQDISNYIFNVDAPQRFFMALSDGLAAELALKFAPDKYQMLKARSDESYSSAARADVEDVPIRLDLDSSSSFLAY